jgi:hypothetical protein
MQATGNNGGFKKVSALAGALFLPGRCREPQDISGVLLDEGEIT